jgi:PKD repeat protein
MKKLVLSIAFLLSGLLTMAQEHSHEHIDKGEILKCGATQAANQVFEEFPEYGIQNSEDQERMQAEYEEYLATWSPDDRSTYIVPVVVHVVHLGGPENISNEQIYEGIQLLNDDFNMLNEDIDATIDEFSGIIGNCDIEFRLATIGPDGECHSGITRTFSSTTYDTGMAAGGHAIVEAVREEHGNWRQNKYMNVFICIEPNGAAGYTYNPGGWYPAGDMYGSIFLRHDYMGVSGTADERGRHTLSHEVGHWLNLSHPWGGSNSPTLPTNCGIDDGVADTPNTIGWNNCSNLYGETCGSLDNVQNIMDYSYCSTMFTEGQAARVQSSLLGATAQRYKLSLPSNLVATGVDGPGDLCEAKFRSDKNSTCTGGTIQFFDESYNTVTGRTWTFEGGSPATSTAMNPVVTYDTPGFYTVTLEATDGAITETTTKTDYILVLDNDGLSIPYHQGFESFTTFPEDERFVIEDDAADGVAWELTSEASYSGGKSIKLNNFGLNTKSKDAVLSGTIDLSGVDPEDELIFNFKYAYKKRLTGNDEWLRFYISKDCGETWALRKNVSGDDLSEEVYGAAYTPSSPDEWYNVSVTNIFDDYFVSNFRYKIEFENDNGNDIYIDHINMYPVSMTGLDEFDTDLDLSLYPNPVQENATLEISAINGENYSINVFSTMGKNVLNVHEGELANGQNKLTIDTRQLATGMYFVQVESNGKVDTIKLVKK